METKSCNIRRMVPKIVDDPAEISKCFSNLLSLTLDAASISKDAGLEADCFIDAWKHGTRIKNAVDLKVSQASQELADLSFSQPEQQQSASADLDIKETISQFFCSIDQIVQNIESAEVTHFNAMKVLPGVDIRNNGRISSYKIASPDQDPSSQAAIDVWSTLRRLREASEKISMAKTGGSYQVIDGVHTGCTGTIDLRGSLLKLLS